MKEIGVEGFRVRVENGELKGLVATVPELPGIVAQADDETGIRREVAKLIRLHVTEIARQGMPKAGRKSARPSGEGENSKPDEPGKRRIGRRLQ
jgi:predicted RNase H-like HicB family nuclease